MNSVAHNYAQLPFQSKMKLLIAGHKALHDLALISTTFLLVLSACSHIGLALPKPLHRRFPPSQQVFLGGGSANHLEGCPNRSGEGLENLHFS